MLENLADELVSSVPRSSSAPATSSAAGSPSSGHMSYARTRTVGTTRRRRAVSTTHSVRVVRRANVQVHTPEVEAAEGGDELFC